MKHNASRITLLPLLFALSGCGYNQVQASGTTPIPQSLILAAERASHSSMALADIMARSHGQSVRDIELEVPNANVPDFLLQRVRLDYNGPMEQVLSRVSTDIGYRVTEYNEPASGRSWEPWIRLSGDKPLVQHFKEMNSQTPWHLVLDHRNRRIVLDYDSDGSMAKQVRRAQQGLNEERQTSTARLPSTNRIDENARRQVSNDVIPAPVMPSQQAQTAHSAPTPQASSHRNALPPEGRGYWHAKISGYQNNDRAEEMTQWLEANDFIGIVRQSGSQFAVHIPAHDDQHAADLSQELSEMGVPTTVHYYSVGSDSRRNNPQMTENAPTHQTASASVATNRPQASTPQKAEPDELLWFVQIAYTPVEQGARDLAAANEINGKPTRAYAQGRGWAVRAGPYASRNEANTAVRSARQDGFSDAYPVKGSSA